MVHGLEVSWGQNPRMWPCPLKSRVTPCKRQAAGRSCGWQAPAGLRHPSASRASPGCGKLCRAARMLIACHTAASATVGLILQTSTFS